MRVSVKNVAFVSSRMRHPPKPTALPRAQGHVKFPEESARPGVKNSHTSVVVTVSQSSPIDPSTVVRH